MPRMPGRNLAFCLLYMGLNPATACAVPWMEVTKTWSPGAVGDP